MRTSILYSFRYSEGCGCSYCKYLVEIIQTKLSKLEPYVKELDRNHEQFRRQVI